MLTPSVASRLPFAPPVWVLLAAGCLHGVPRGGLGAGALLCRLLQICAAQKQPHARSGGETRLPARGRRVRDSKRLHGPVLLWSGRHRAARHAGLPCGWVHRPGLRWLAGTLAWVCVSTCPCRWLWARVIAPTRAATPRLACPAAAGAHRQQQQRRRAHDSGAQPRHLGDGGHRREEHRRVRSRGAGEKGAPVPALPSLPPTPTCPLCARIRTEQPRCAALPPPTQRSAVANEGEYDKIVRQVERVDEVATGARPPLPAPPPSRRPCCCRCC